MTINSSKKLTALSISLISLILTGCFSQGGPHHLYILSSTADPEISAKTNPTPSIREQTVLGVGPIRLAEYLNRSEIMVADGQDSIIRLEDTDQWSEPLKDGVTRTLTLDLQHRLGQSVHVTAYPWSRNTSPDLQLEINIEQFHADRRTGKGWLIADWSLLSHDKLIKRNRSQLAIVATAVDVDSMVMAMSHTLTHFADEMAATIDAPSKP